MPEHIKVTVSILIIFIIIAIFILSFEYFGFNCGGQVKIPLKTLREIYFINEDKWSYRTNSYWSDIRHLYYQLSWDSYTQIKLSLIGFLWLQWVIYSEKYRKFKKEEKNALISILTDCQKDIDALRALAEKEKTEAIKTQKEIFERWIENASVASKTNSLS